MKILIALFLFLLTSVNTFAQAPGDDVYMLAMSGTLPYVLFFYFVTFISLGLLLLKLVRPSFPVAWLYISCIVGIIGAAIVNLSFDDVQTKQLPKIEQDKEMEEKLSPDLKEQLHIKERAVESQFYANFWIIAVPNFVILGLGFFVDRNYRRRDPNKPRGRYD